MRYQLAIAVCCREWKVALGFRWGTCGLCGERPTFSHALDEWVEPRPPIDQRPATLDRNKGGDVL